MKNEENDQSNLFYKKSDIEALPVHSLISTQIGRAARRLHSRPALFHLIWFGCCSNMYLLCYGCSLLKYKQKNLFIYLLPVYISIICTCSTIFFCEAALLVFRAFCVGHAISAAAPQFSFSFSRLFHEIFHDGTTSYAQHYGLNRSRPVFNISRYFVTLSMMGKLKPEYIYITKDKWFF